MVDSVRVLLREKRGRRIVSREIVIPTDNAMESIALEMHLAAVPAVREVLGWKVLYLPAATLRYSVTDVEALTGQRGTSERKEVATHPHCIFGYGAEWQVEFSWLPDSDRPKRTQLCGETVPAGPSQATLFQHIP